MKIFVTTLKLFILSFLFSLASSWFSLRGSRVLAVEIADLNSLVRELESQLNIPVTTLNPLMLDAGDSGHFHQYFRVRPGTLTELTPLGVEVGWRYPLRDMNLMGEGPAFSSGFHRLTHGFASAPDYVNALRTDLLLYKGMEEFGGPMVYGAAINLRNSHIGLLVEHIQGTNGYDLFRSGATTPGDFRALLSLHGSAFRKGAILSDAKLNNLVFSRPGVVRPIDVVKIPLKAGDYPWYHLSVDALRELQMGALGYSGEQILNSVSVQQRLRTYITHAPIDLADRIGVKNARRLTRISPIMKRMMRLAR